MKSLSIVGTAGRKEDAAKLTQSSFGRMVEAVKAILPGWPLTLVSGGAAFADHVAVALFLEDPKRFSLKLELPAPFDVQNARYEEAKDASGKVLTGAKNPGGTSNYYHRMFSQKTERNSGVDIADAIAAGAEIRVGNGFFDRNTTVAQADGIVALTFGNGAFLKDGGTEDTVRKFLTRGRQGPSWHIDLHTWQVFSPAQVSAK